jgi:hypothetical protein
MNLNESVKFPLELFTFYPAELFIMAVTEAGTNEKGT